MDEVHYAYSNEEIQHYQEIGCVLNLQSFAFYSKRQSKARNTNKCGMHWPHWDQWTEKSNTKERRSAQEHSITKTNCGRQLHKEKHILQHRITELEAKNTNWQL